MWVLSKTEQIRMPNRIAGQETVWVANGFFFAVVPFLMLISLGNSE